ncbi:uncharacterized protein FPRO_16147 [Fusarium proliferatum ET1]|uniref:BZIP domain-containing protein n=1 Tax=Fusarium proliferatum (strain ET1) TaxID=1227346 RepID=A0A1L7WBF2_FUSPR|nr:uncharacterized protein FPRO_16147 [Fusarium proliferatum ET1]CZR49943.1 uncharacterized protein FPRO_16147 [Fusarium proliferatum ET1]
MAVARRLKKQEADRKSQKRVRERTKSRIAHLENMVETLRQNDSKAQILTLMDQLGQVTKERDNLLQVLKSLDSTIGRHLGNSTTSNPAPDTKSELSTHASTRGPTTPEWGEQTVPVTVTGGFSEMCSPTTLETPMGPPPSSLFAYSYTASHEPYSTAFGNLIPPPDVNQLWQLSGLESDIVPWPQRVPQG